MKKLILVSGLWLAVLCWAQAQSYSYVAFPDTNADWYTTHNLYFQNAAIPLCNHYYYTGDTIIEGKDYSKLFHTAPDFLFGFIRTDSSKKTWFLENKLPDHTIVGDTLEHIIYDFNLNEGDTLIDTFFQNGYYHYYHTVIDSIRMININGERRKMFYNHEWRHQNINYNFASSAWIEGVGSNRGPTGHFFYYVEGIESSLLKFTLNGNIVYQAHYIYDHCHVFTELVTETISTPFSLTPNPASSYLTISISEEHTGSTFALTDLTGRVVLQSEIENPKSDINIATLPSGIYLAVLTTPNGQRAVRKVVKE